MARAGKKWSSTWRVLLGIVCVLLLLLGTTVQVAHTHAAGPANGLAAHADCSLCLSAHQSVEPSANDLVTLTPIVSHGEMIEVQPDLEFRFVAFSLRNRPPPEGLAHS